MNTYIVAGESMVVDRCPNCHTLHAFSKEIYLSAHEGKEKASIYCPRGHGWHYTGKTDLQKKQDEIDELNRRIQRKVQNEAYLEDEIKAARHQAAAFKGVITKIKKRVGKGVCPCCNRHFSDLERHMKNKHSEFHTEAA